MPRLNNKDFTVEELEKLLYYINVVMSEQVVKSGEIDLVYEEIKELLKGSQFTNFEDGERKPNPIPWNFKFEMLINPETIESANMIRNAMRSAEVNENIKNRFSAMVREEVNWYKDKVKYFMVKGDTNILE
jgi:hypothetical protein